jgi:hypothetical protein
MTLVTFPELEKPKRKAKKVRPNPRLKLTAKAPGVAKFLVFAFLGYN